MIKTVNKTKKVILDLLYPPRCPVCHDIVENGSGIICKNCIEKLPFVTGPTCRRCGKPLGDDEEAGEMQDLEEKLCTDCQETEHIFRQGVGIFVYDDVMRKSIYQFKYQGRREYGKFYGMCAWQAAGEKLRSWKPQTIVPVPLHRKKYRMRGYNQAEVVAAQLGGYLKIPVQSGCVVRVKNTKAQKDLSPELRRENLEGAFAPGKEKLAGRRILLVDDIYTTGSTADAVSRVLAESGACEIYVLSVCIGKGNMIQ